VAAKTNLFILRHGLAVEPGTAGYAKDADRPLTAEGKAKLREIAAAMEKLGLDFDIILSSPYKRARQTAEIVAEELEKKVQFSETLTPQGQVKTLIDFLNRLRPPAQNVLLVGHEPYLSELISLLISGERHASVVMKKGGLAKLSVESLKPGRCAALQWLLTPKQMGMIGR
jgi:phosphohistidine phosphatase